MGRRSLAASGRRSEHSEQTAHKPKTWSNSEFDACTESNADCESENDGRSAPDGIIIHQFNLRHLLIRMYVLRNTRLQVQTIKYRLKGLEESLQVKMDEVASQPLLLYKFQRRVLRLMDVYRQGATGRLAAYVA
jgi:hypothetical protein